MCHQINYTLLCEHVKTEIVFCAAAPAVSQPSSSSSKGSSSKGSSSKKGSSSSSSKGKEKSSSSESKSKKSSSSSSGGSSKRKPCKNLTQQSLPYPTPPSFAGDPSWAASSPLSPKCPLANCPFEAKNRCWNCCWCGKAWNQVGRCSCIMTIDGNQVQCEHICCETCEAADG